VSLLRQTHVPDRTAGASAALSPPMNVEPSKKPPAHAPDRIFDPAQTQRCCLVRTTGWKIVFAGGKYRCQEPWKAGQRPANRVASLRSAPNRINQEKLSADNLQKQKTRVSPG
jgi:hypothetical protein